VEEDLPHVGRDTRPPPPRRLMGAGRIAKTNLHPDRLRNSNEVFGYVLPLMAPVTPEPY